MVEQPINAPLQAPCNVEAEQSVLGSVLIDAACIATVVERLKTEDFYIQANRLIYEAMLDLYNRGEPVDVVTVSKQLGDVAAVGGFEYLARLAVTVPTTENLKYYVSIVEEKSLLRKLINSSNDILSLCYTGDEEVGIILDTAEKRIFDILQNRGHRGMTHIKSVLEANFVRLEELAKNRGKATGVPTGFTDLDRITAGLQPSDLIIIASRPAMGKTSFALNIAQNAAMHHNITSAVFSLEMSKEQLGNRVLWSEAMISGEKIRTGNIGDEDWPMLARAVSMLAKAPLYIDDSPGITVSEMRAKCRRLKLEKNLGLIVVDYLQLMSGGRRSDNRQQEISEISRSLKILAKELDVPVVALSQLSRAPTQRSDHKPQLSDLRESGAIEQDADIVMFLHRQDYYDPDTEKKNIAECIISKHRNGPTGTIELYWQGEITRFKDLAREGGYNN